MAQIAALGRPRLPKPELPVLKAPSLPDDFAQRLAALDKEIFERGLAVDRERLLSLGRERFEQLLGLDRKARSWQKVADFTRWESVQNGLQAFLADSFPNAKPPSSCQATAGNATKCAGSAASTTCGKPPNGRN